jgi:hypothetical protein
MFAGLLLVLRGDNMPDNMIDNNTLWCGISGFSTGFFSQSGISCIHLLVSAELQLVITPTPKQTDKQMSQ